LRECLHERISTWLFRAPFDSARDSARLAQGLPFDPAARDSARLAQGLPTPCSNGINDRVDGLAPIPASRCGGPAFDCPRHEQFFEVAEKLFAPPLVNGAGEQPLGKPGRTRSLPTGALAGRGLPTGALAGRGLPTGALA
jgi:hypothetical protein